LLTSRLGELGFQALEKQATGATKKHGSSRILIEVVNGKILLDCSKNAKKSDDNA
jgi:hypothetical protein